jgi:hypothetical protein
MDSSPFSRARDDPPTRGRYGGGLKEENPSPLGNNAVMKSSSFSSSASGSPAIPMDATAADVLGTIISPAELSFPRCSCCGTEWYKTQIDHDNDNDHDHDDDDGGVGTDAKAPAADDANGRRRERRSRRSHSRRHGRPSHLDLLQMPRCECIIRLAVPPPIPSKIVAVEGGRREDDGNSRHARIVETSIFNNLATCSSCLKRRIVASGEIAVHDYRMGDVPNGQRDVPFTVGLFCVQCRKKFSVRSLERLLVENDDAYRRHRRRPPPSPGTTIGKKVDGGRKKISDADRWRDAVEATIELVGRAKRKMRRERKRRRRRNIQRGGSEGPDDGIADRIETIRWVDARVRSAGEDDDDCSSDECYSLSSTSDSGDRGSERPGDDYVNDDVDDDDDHGFARRSTRKGHRRVELESGELMKELLRKDPLFRQEREDEEYVKRVVEGDMETLRAREDQERENEICIKRILEEEEEERRRESEARSREDRELAVKIQEELDKQKDKAGPIATRSSKSTILDTWKKSPSASGKKSGRVSSCESSRKKRPCRRDSDGASPCLEASLAPGASSRSPSPERIAVDQGSKPCEQSKERSNADNIVGSRMDGTFVEEILAMGFSKASARRCLEDSNGNVQLAVSMLLSEASEGGD